MPIREHMSQTHLQKRLHIPLNELPPDGRELTVTDQSIWQDGINEFSLSCQLVDELRAEVSLLPTQEGCLVRGHLSGRVVLPCTRCAEDVSHTLDWNFEDFESLPEEARADSLSDNFSDNFSAPSDEREEQSFEDETRIDLEQGRPVLDLAAVLWEEFLLSLPLTPLCSPQCRGLCPGCGANLNHGSCTCAKDEGDPRLAVFRTMKLASSDKNRISTKKT